MKMKNGMKKNGMSKRKKKKFSLSLSFFFLVVVQKKKGAEFFFFSCFWKLLLLLKKKIDRNYEMLFFLSFFSLPLLFSLLFQKIPRAADCFSFLFWKASDKNHPFSSLFIHSNKQKNTFLGFQFCLYSKIKKTKPTKKRETKKRSFIEILMKTEIQNGTNIFVCPCHCQPFLFLIKFVFLIKNILWHKKNILNLKIIWKEKGFEEKDFEEIDFEEKRERKPEEKFDHLYLYRLLQKFYELRLWFFLHYVKV